MVQFKGQKRRKLGFVCLLHICLQVHLCCCFHHCIPLLILKSVSSGFQHSLLNPSSSLRFLHIFSARLGLQRHLASWIEQLLHSSPLQCETVMSGLPRAYPTRQSSKISFGYMFIHSISSVLLEQWFSTHVSPPSTGITHQVFTL